MSKSLEHRLAWIKGLARELSNGSNNPSSQNQRNEFERILTERLEPLIEAGEELAHSKDWPPKQADSAAWDAALAKVKES